MAKYDPAKFNTDPKHQEQRDFLDAINEASIDRILKKKKAAAPPEDVNVFDELFGTKED